MFEQEFGTDWASFSGADAFRRGIYLHSASLPSRHLLHKICPPRHFWVFAEVFGLFSQDCGTDLAHFCAADAFRRQIRLPSASAPLRYLPFQIYRPQNLWIFAGFFGDFEFWVSKKPPHKDAKFAIVPRGGAPIEPGVTHPLT